MIDFHCHLDLYPNPIEVRDECERRGLYLLSVTTTPSAWTKTAALARGAKRIRTGLGLHPQIAHERHKELSLFDALLPSARYVGEIGLDGANEYRAHWDVQISVFDHILSRCAAVGGRIMSIHSRRATSAVLERLESFKSAGTPVLHWYSGTQRQLDRAIELGCWFSVGPAMLLSAKGRDLVSRMPADKILTESDGPFAQIDGAAVLPWQMDKTVADLAGFWSIPFSEATQRLNSNLRMLLSSIDERA